MKNKKLVLYGLLITCITTIANADNGTTYDKTSITSQTWEEVDLTYINTINGKNYTEQANLLRPIGWIKRHQLDKVGATMHLTKDEIGGDVDAKVVAIKPTKLNYANNVPGNNKPVISTFVKHSDDVWDYTFKEQNGHTEKVKATSNHPFYSLDRRAYISIGQIKIGEHLKTDNSEDIVLASKVKHNKGVEVVYNFEVYQAHNYKIGNISLLVHNTCITQMEDILQSPENYPYGALKRKGNIVASQEKLVTDIYEQTIKTITKSSTGLLPNYVTYIEPQRLLTYRLTTTEATTKAMADFRLSKNPTYKLMEDLCFGNCGEQSSYVTHQLQNNGLTAAQYGVEGMDHRLAIVFASNKNFIPTWIVDPWKGDVIRYQNFTERYGQATFLKVREPSKYD